MNRTQARLLLGGSVLLALILLFPPWATSDGTAKISLGYSWILSPPEGLGPDDFRGLSLSDEWTEQDRQRMREHLASGYGAPEIDWDMHGFALVVVFTILIANVFAYRGSPRRAARS